MTALEGNLKGLDARQLTLRQSLHERRELIAEVLASLQRMGRRPPPAMLVGPDDVLKSVRTAMLLGTLVPEMRDAVTVLARDLEELSGLRRRIASNRTSCAARPRTCATSVSGSTPSPMRAARRSRRASNRWRRRRRAPRRSPARPPISNI